MFHKLTVPDERICQVCLGMVYYYVETPGRNLPIEAEQRRCNLPHADRVLVQNGVETPMYPQAANAWR